MPPHQHIPPGDMLDGWEAATTQVARPSVVGAGWRWRYELGALLGLAGSAAGLYVKTGITGLITGVAIAGAALTAAMSWPASRERVVGRVMCVVVQHRVRTACAAAWVQTRTGRLPSILWAVPQPFGESVLLWCHTGITPADLVRAREILRCACWATDVRVIPDERRPHRVRLDIIRIPSAYDSPASEESRAAADEADTEPPLSRRLPVVNGRDAEPAVRRHERLLQP
jgi:hypothetical protein